MPAPSIVRDTGAVITNQTTEDQTASFGTAPAAGNAIIAYGNIYTGNGLAVTALAVSDNQGGTSYSEDAANSLSDGGGSSMCRIGLHRRQSITTGSPFTVTWNATGGGTVPYWFVVAFEVADLAASPVDAGGGANVNNYDLDTDVSLTGGTLAQADNLAFAGLALSTGTDNGSITCTSWTVEEQSPNGTASVEGAIASRVTSTTDALTSAWAHNNYVGDTAGRGCAFLVVYKGAANAPIITAQPTDQFIADGATGTFTVTATGATSYQWETRATDGGAWANVTGGSGGTTASYTTPTLTRASDSGRVYRCQVTNANGTTTSRTATAFMTNIPTSYAASVGMVIGSNA